MRSAVEDKACYSLGPATPEISSGTGNAAISFEFHKGNAGANRTPNHHRAGLGKPAPSKWDDAQKWLVGLSRGVGHGAGNSNSQLSKTSKPRNSNADDLRLIASASQRERGCDEEVEDEEGANNQLEVETKKVDCEESSSVWRINKKLDNNPMAAVRSVCVRDMGTEMTPIASQEPSRTATPIRATTPAARSPISSGSSTPVRGQNGTMQGQIPIEGRNEGNNNPNISKIHESNIGKNGSEKILKMNPLDTRAAAWDEAERAKYMARYKREEVKIQAWENHQKRKAEMEMKKMEVKAERMKARAQEKFSNKLASTRRIAEEKRANAESKLNEKAVRTSERADYIRRTGHLPSSFSFKLPSLCW